MSNEMIGSLSGASASGTRLPFLSAGKVGAQYGLKLLGVSQWEAKKSPNQKKGDWRCQFKVEVIHSEGDGATPSKTVCGLLIMEDKQYGTYHLQDFRNIATPVFESNGLFWLENDQEKNTQQIADLFSGKFNGTIFAAQLSPNPNEKRAKFPICTYFPVKDEETTPEPVKAE